MRNYTFNDSIVNILKDKLNSSFPLYDPNSEIHALTVDGYMCIGYHESDDPTKRFLDNSFDLQIHPRKKLCDILHFSIFKENRRKKNGTKLYSLIESFCFYNLGCRNFTTTPSGDSTKGFWEAMGFSYFESEKKLSALKLILN